MSQKKGFTLLELIIVIVIMGILATLGFAQYGRMMERSRGAEARQVLGAIRTQAAAKYMELGGVPGKLVAGTIDNTFVGIGNAAGQISVACTTSSPSTGYYFRYGVTQTAADILVATASRCTGNTGKQPGGPSTTTLILTSDFANGTDTWTGNGGY